MENSKPLAELLNNVDTSYMTQAEKEAAIERAESIELIMKAVSVVYMSAKKAVTSLKDTIQAYVAKQVHHA